MPKGADKACKHRTYLVITLSEGASITVLIMAYIEREHIKRSIPRGEYITVQTKGPTQ